VQAKPSSQNARAEASCGKVTDAEIAGIEGTMSRYKHQLGMGRLRVRGFKAVRYTAFLRARPAYNFLSWSVIAYLTGESDRKPESAQSRASASE
jgi:hypothetical protein